MKKIAILILASLVFLAGCIDKEVKVTVKPDGSGIIHETVLIKKEMYDQIMKQREKSNSKNKKLYTDEKLKERAEGYGSGVTYESVTELEKEKRVGYKVVYTFKDINSVQVNRNMKDNVGKRKSGEEETDPADFITFEMKKEDDKSVLTINIPEKKPEDSDDKTDEPIDEKKLEKDIKLMQLFFDGMRLALHVEIDGTISRTSATHRKENRIIVYDLDFSELVKDTEKMKELSRSKPKTTAEMQKLLSDVPGFVMETKPRIKIYFEKNSP
jgi:hypothetical protein